MESKYIILFLGLLISTSSNINSTFIFTSQINHFKDKLKNDSRNLERTNSILSKKDVSEFEKCDVACTECFGPFDNKYPTTNCHYSKCNFEKGYFPLEYNTTICFNESDKENWENKLNLKCKLFLDKSKNEKEKWIWTCCDPHCESCHIRNNTNNMNCDTCKTNEGFYFYLNQSINKGIPGNCHKNCIGKGCYKCESEGIEKMCPCLNNCKICQNDRTCDECFKNYLLHPEKTSCNNKCEYCYTPYFEKQETKEKGICINCATYFDPPQYTFNNKCYSKKPTFEYEAIKPYKEIYLLKNIIKEYHVIDDFCNLLTACKEGCKTCQTLKTDECLECELDYYKGEDLNVQKQKIVTNQKMKYAFNVRMNII